MVNNAGIAIEALDPQPIHTTSEKTWDTTMRVNAKSVFLGCKYAITQMLAQEPHSSGDRGWIINISSIYGLVGGADNRMLKPSLGYSTEFPVTARLQSKILNPKLSLQMLLRKRANIH